MLIFPDEIEEVEGWLRSEAFTEGGGGTDLAATPMFTVSSKSRKEVSVDRVATIRGTSDLAV